MKESGIRKSTPTPTEAALPALGRRRWLYGAVAGTATLVGLGLARWQEQRNSESTPGTALWSLAFEARSGPALRMQNFLGKPLLLNFWATWCAPCVEEFPLLDSFYRENAPNGWQVLGLAADKLSAVDSFLKRVPVQFPVALAGLSGIDLSKTLGNTAGGLPFTTIWGSAGQLLDRKIGRVTVQDLATWSALR